MNSADVVPGAAREWFAAHPRVLHAACLGLLGVAVVQFFQAAELVVRSRDLIGLAQREVSEALGG
jgi:hypothetical protein